VRQRVSLREHLRRGNAATILIVALHEPGSISRLSACRVRIVSAANPLRRNITSAWQIGHVSSQGNQCLRGSIVSPEWHSGGQGFDSPWLHHRPAQLVVIPGRVFAPQREPTFWPTRNLCRSLTSEPALWWFIRNQIAKTNRFATCRSRHTAAQLDRGRELAPLLVDGADRSGIRLGDNEHRWSMGSRPRPTRREGGLVSGGFDAAQPARASRRRYAATQEPLQLALCPRRGRRRYGLASSTASTSSL
jgi:hypothetical protein